MMKVTRDTRGDDSMNRRQRRVQARIGILARQLGLAHQDLETILTGGEPIQTRMAPGPVVVHDVRGEVAEIKRLYAKAYGECER